MSHEEGLLALKNGDFRLAIPLLENAVRETGYSSDVFNHAYTLALYRAGEKTRLADAAFTIGDTLLETNPAAAMDYFQRALLGGLDAACVRHIGEIFERWAEASPGRDLSSIEKPIRKVAHVAGCLAKDYPPAQHISTLVKSLRQQGVESLVFTTEWAASWFFNPAGELQSSSVEDLDVTIASAEGDFAERAARIASAIRASGVPVAFYHAGLEEQITTRVAAHRPAPIQVNISYGAAMEPALFDGYVHLTKEGLSSTRHSTEHGAWIPPASDIEERIRACPPNLRQLMALESAETVSATLGDLQSASDPGFLRVLAELLRQFPGHYHLFAGPGDVKAVRGYLHAEEVLPRARFMGSMSEAASVMAVTDFCLMPFLESGDGLMVIEAIGAGKPVVALEKSKSADLLKVTDLVARTESEYAQIAQRLIRDRKERERGATLVQSRFREEFDPALLGPRYMRFVDRILQG
jgi:hypothetical protein